MAISKVIYKSSASAQGEIWIDATPATAAAADIMSPKTAMLADGVVTLGTGTGGGGVVSGTFSPASNSQTVTLTDCIGCTSICVYPTTSIVAPASGRTHWGCMIIDGGVKATGSTNSSNSSWSLRSGGSDTWDGSTGTLTITIGTGTNYGGYWTSGMTYAYRAW